MRRPKRRGLGQRVGRRPEPGAGHPPGADECREGAPCGGPVQATLAVAPVVGTEPLEVRPSSLPSSTRSQQASVPLQTKPSLTTADASQLQGRAETWLLLSLTSAHDDRGHPAWPRAGERMRVN